MNITFTKMHGLGNDFIVLDAMKSPALLDRADLCELARAMCDRRCGIGADGVLIVGPDDDDDDAHAALEVINADGSRPEMCGNGLRCIAKYLHDAGRASGGCGGSGGPGDAIRIRTARGVLDIAYTRNGRGELATATVDMGEPILDPVAIPVALPQLHDGPIVDLPLESCIASTVASAVQEKVGGQPRITCVSMGNPHVVLFCRDVAAVPLDTLGPLLERQPIFPRGINVHFAQVLDRSRVLVRHWERGAGPTLACGTGACAVCVAGSLAGRADRRLTAHVPGGELTLHWRETTNHLHLTGPAVRVFDGTWHASTSSRR